MTDSAVGPPLEARVAERTAKCRSLAPEGPAEVIRIARFPSILAGNP